MSLLSKAIARLRLLRLVIGFKISRQFLIAPYTRDFSRALRKLQIIGRKSDWFIAPFALVVIARGSYFGIGFSSVNWKPPLILRERICNSLLRHLQWSFNSDRNVNLPSAKSAGGNVRPQARILGASPRGETVGRWKGTQTSSRVQALVQQS